MAKSKPAIATDTDRTPASTEALPVMTGIETEDRKALAEGLARVLADSYTLLGKTHGFHWNVTGDQFHSLHEMFQTQYEDLTAAVDEIAERIRALGHFAPGSLSQFLKLTKIEDEHGVPTAKGMLEQLVRDNEQVTRACREVVELADEAGDTVTEDLMNQRMAAHEKAAWMLRSSIG
ncbi:Dps family protein [Niveispirillum irakense]|uniref:Dps family protein n=1 Tax=Niveispirillum irakense TaxID=34011 RepID=UPI000407A8F0|nr:Dps family protein [Niveispirillum irakense]